MRRAGRQKSIPLTSSLRRGGKSFPVTTLAFYSLSWVYQGLYLPLASWPFEPMAWEWKNEKWIPLPPPTVLAGTVMAFVGPHNIGISMRTCRSNIISHHTSRRKREMRTRTTLIDMDAAGRGAWWVMSDLR